MLEMDEEVGCDTELLDWFYLDSWENMSIALSIGMHANVWFVDEDNPPDDARECVGVNVYFAGIDLDYPLTIRHFLKSVIDMYDTSEVVETWRELETQVEDLERIHVRISRTPWAPGRRDDFVAEEYPFMRAAPGTWTVARWRNTRLAPQLPTHPTITIQYPDGSPVPGQTRLSTLRSAWASAPTPPVVDAEQRVFEVMRDTRWAGYILSVTE